MYTILTGRPPFEGKTVDELLHNIAETDPPFPRNVTSDVPKDLQAICLACLTRDPEQRPGAAEVAADLARFRAREPVRLRPALYSDLLRRRIAEHSNELRNWEEQGILSQSENDRLSVVYRRLLDDEDPWIFDSRRLSIPQTLLYATTWMVVVASAYLVNFAWGDLTPLARWAFPTWCSVALLAIGLTAYARREVIAAASFLAGAVVAAFPAIVSILAEFDLVSGGSGQQLLDEPFSNDRLLVAAAGTLALSLLWLTVMRLTAFAWTTALLISCTYIAFLITHGWLDLNPDEQAFQLLPLTLLVAPALWLEHRGRVRWALPFHIAALAFLVVPLTVMAGEGYHFDRVGLGDAFDSQDTRMYFAFALNGLIFMGLMYATERAWSLDLRRAAGILQLLVPIHLLASLYANAKDHEGWGSAGLYLGAVALLLLLGPWRNRRWFVTGGLSGIALGCFLLIDLELVDARLFTVSLCAAAMVAALATHLYLLKRRG